MHVVSNDYLIQIGTAGKQSDLVVEVDNQKITKIQTFKTSFSGDLFKSVMMQLDIDVKDGTLLNGKEIKSKYGLLVNDIYEYITYNTFYTYSSEFNYDTNICKTIAYDAMVKFMVDYFSGHLNLTYPTTILNLTQAICNYIGVPLLNTDFYNADLVIEEELFTNLNCTYRDIIDYICQATCTTAIIKNNSLYFKTPEETNVTITPSLLKKLKIIKTFGPCNSLVLGRGDLNDNIFSKDDESIGEYGLQEIKFDNNEIIDKRRETVIDSMFNQIKGLTYNSFESSDLGVGIFEPADIANMQDLNGNNYRVIILNQSMTITSGAKGEMSASEPSTSTTQYKYATDSQKRQKKTEILVNKQDGIITSLVEEQSETQKQIVQVTQNINNIQNLFQITGGSNLIQDSTGLFGLEEAHWIKEEGGTYEPYGEDSSLIGETISASQLTVGNGSLVSSNTNIINLSLQEVKSLSFKYKQDENTTTTVKVYGMNEDKPFYSETFTGEQKYWKEVSASFNIDVPNIFIKIESTSTLEGVFHISDLMLNNGDKKSWEPSANEIWGTVVKLSQIGLQVYSVQGNICTLMTSTGFQIREYNNNTIGDIITDFTRTGINTGDITQTGTHTQDKLVSKKITDDSNNEIYVEYIKD